MINTRFISIAFIILAAVVMSLALFGAVNNYFTDDGYVYAAQTTASATDLFHNDPTYDSGWLSINKDQEKTFPHNIGGHPDRYVVDLQFKDTGPSGFGVNQEGYGGVEYLDFFGIGNPIMIQNGAYWFGLTNKEIKVKRQIDDNRADKIRVRIWLQTTPSFDSEWKPIAADGALKNIDHNLGRGYG